MVQTMGKQCRSTKRHHILYSSSFLVFCSPSLSTHAFSRHTRCPLHPTISLSLSLFHSLSKLTMWWVFINSSPLQSSAFPLENIGLLLASPLHPPHIPLRSLAPAVQGQREGSIRRYTCVYECVLCTVYIQLEKESERQRETQSKSGFLLP